MSFINEQEWYKKLNEEHPGLAEIGDYTYGDCEINLWDTSTMLRIGKFCQIAQGTAFYVGGEHDRKRVSTFPFGILIGEDGGKDRFTKGDIYVGNDVWIGGRSLILSGATIGDGAIIGAGTIVRKNVTIPPYSVAMGNPVEIVARRFMDVQIESLLNIKWWNWPIEKIIEAIPLLREHHIDKFIEKYGG